MKGEQYSMVELAGGHNSMVEHAGGQYSMVKLTLQSVCVSIA